MECIITIDLGTGAVRISGFDLKGELIGFMKGSYPTFHTKPGYSEQDPEQIFITMLYVLKNFLNEKIHPHKYKVLSICFSSAMHSVLSVDKHGVPLGNAVVWSDNRAKREAQQLKESALGKTIYNATGTPIHPMSPLNKITWIKNHDPEKFRHAQKFIAVKSYIIHQLTGDYIIDYSLASATGLMNIHNLQWDKDALSFAGINASRLPELVPVFNSSAKLRKEYQRSLSLPGNVKILAGSSDGCLATLGGGISGEGKATITIEDSGAVRVMGNQVLQDEQQRFFNYLLTPGMYISGGPSNNGGAIFEWFATQFGDFKKAFDLEDCLDDLNQLASKTPAGSAGLLFLPYLQGERAPIWNANAKGVYFGVNIQHEKSHFIRSTIEGILFAIYNIGKTLEEHRKINSLSINGRFASSPLWAQMISDIFNKPVLMKSNADSVATGSYLLSATEMGIYASLEDAAKTVELPERFTPKKGEHETYMKNFVIFERLSTKLADEFEAVSAVQEADAD